MAFEKKEWLDQPAVGPGIVVTRSSAGRSFEHLRGMGLNQGNWVESVIGELMSSQRTGSGSRDRRDIPAKVFKEEEPVSHIFGIPHSLGEIATGIIDIGKKVISERVFGAPVVVPVQPAPTFYSGFGPWDSAPEIISEGWTAGYDLAQSLNEGNGGDVVAVNGEVATFLGCPVEEADGCQPARKRYTITIDEATGKCIKIKRQKSRKRRRRLASLSDIKDLAALKQVIGGGKAFDTWIATRGR